MLDGKVATQKQVAPFQGHLDVDRVRRAFPILQRTIDSKPLIYMDNASTTQKPQCVIDCMSDFMQRSNANVHRGVHRLSAEATDAYESARERMGSFLGGADRKEIVFVRGATEAVNLVAQSYARPRLSPGDEVLVTQMEHHSNLVPWQVVCRQTGATLRLAPVCEDGSLDVHAFDRLLSRRTRILAVTHVSNTLGTINPVAQLVEKAHAVGARVLIDGAQAVPHFGVDVKDLGCDFYAFSGHKIFGPTGIGVLFGKRERLEEMEPYQTGGDMIRLVTPEESTFNVLPYKFEAGTPNIVGAVGLAEAVAFIEGIGFEAISAHENSLLEFLQRRMAEIPDIKIIGTATPKSAVVSFTMGDVHPHDIGTILDSEGIAIRAGHHCTQPLMRRFDVPATARVSLSLTNTHAEVDRLIDALHRVREFLG